jgi:hypothetical protein
LRSFNAQVIAARLMLLAVPYAADLEMCGHPDEAHQVRHRALVALLQEVAPQI